MHPRVVVSVFRGHGPRFDPAAQQHRTLSSCWYTVHKVWKGDPWGVASGVGLLLGGPLGAGGVNPSKRTKAC